MSIEVLKSLDDIGEPDPRNLIRVFVNRTTGAQRQNTLILRIPERLIEERKRLEEPDRGRLDIGFHNASKMVMTAYQQSRGHDRGPAAAAYQTRCLDIIDNMILVDRGSMETELRKLDES